MKRPWLGTKYMLMWHLLGLAGRQQQGYIDTHVAAWVVPLAQLTRWVVCGYISDMAISQTPHPVGTVGGAPSFSFAMPPMHTAVTYHPRPDHHTTLQVLLQLAWALHACAHIASSAAPVAHTASSQSQHGENQPTIHLRACAQSGHWWLAGMHTVGWAACALVVDWCFPARTYCWSHINTIPDMHTPGSS